MAKGESWEIKVREAGEQGARTGGFTIPVPSSLPPLYSI